ncbi:MAG: hypothetical protein LBC96_02885 [Lachnospiraceae bacterium]|jgi:hypothetical protein|nr:hypothetical protein [Lachnospiraceae bacterium]
MKKVRSTVLITLMILLFGCTNIDTDDTIDTPDEVTGAQIDIIDTQEQACENCEEYKHKYYKLVELTTESSKENTETQNQEDDVICTTCEETSSLDNDQLVGSSSEVSYFTTITQGDVETHLGIRTIRWFEVVEMTDERLMMQINRELGKAATSWIKGVVVPENVRASVLISANNRFLSMKMGYDTGNYQRKHLYYVYITIDIQSGNRVFLNDLIRVDNEFATLFHSGDIVQPVFYAHDDFDIDGHTENLVQGLSRMTKVEVLEVLEQCSIDKADKEYNDRSREFYNSSFYVEPGKLIIVIPKGVISYRLAINTDDIEDFLLVPKW